MVYDKQCLNRPSEVFVLASFTYFRSQQNNYAPAKRAREINYCTLFLCSPKNFGGAYSRRLVRPSVRPSVRQSVRTTHSCPAHNFVI